MKDALERHRARYGHRRIGQELRKTGASVGREGPQATGAPPSVTARAPDALRGRSEAAWGPTAPFGPRQGPARRRAERRRGRSPRR